MTAIIVNWIDDQTDQMVTDVPDTLVFNYGPMNPTDLQAVLIDRDLTVGRHDVSPNVVGITAFLTIDTGARVLTDEGLLITLGGATQNANPIQLNAVLKDRDLTTERL